MPQDDDGRPSFAEVVKAVSPSGLDWDQWKAAMRQAHQDGGYRPGQVVPDISTPMPAQMTRCTYCETYHDRRVDCGHGPKPLGMSPDPGRPSREDLGLPPLYPAGGTQPADPFSEADAPSVALAEMYHGMVRAGIPVASVEGILGRMLAEHGRDDPEPPDER